MCRVGIRSELPHLASRPRYKKRKTLEFTENKPSLSDARRLASTHRSWGTGAVRGSLICRGKAQLVKHRPPMRAPRAAVAARKWPFTPVLRADWNALRSTGLSAPRAAPTAAPHSPVRSWVATTHPTQNGSSGAAHVKREGPRGEICALGTRAGVPAAAPTANHAG